MSAMKNVISILLFRGFRYISGPAVIVQDWLSLTWNQEETVSLALTKTNRKKNPPLNYSLL